MVADDATVVAVIENSVAVIILGYQLLGGTRSSAKTQAPAKPGSDVMVDAQGNKAVSKGSRAYLVDGPSK